MVFLKSKIDSDLPKTMPAQMKTVFVDVCASSSTPDASLKVNAAASFFGSAMFNEFL